MLVVVVLVVVGTVIIVGRVALAGTTIGATLLLLVLSTLAVILALVKVTSVTLRLEKSGGMVILKG